MVAESAEQQPSPLSTIDVWLMGDALGAEPPGGSAYYGRDAGYLVNPEADWDDAADDDVNFAWARELIQSLQPYTVGNYTNFRSRQGPPRRRRSSRGSEARLPPRGCGRRDRRASSPAR